MNPVGVLVQDVMNSVVFNICMRTTHFHCSVQTVTLHLLQSDLGIVKSIKTYLSILRSGNISSCMSVSNNFTCLSVSLVAVLC